MTTSAKKSQVPQYLGRPEVPGKLGISVKTLDRMVNSEAFPRPVRVSPGRVAWSVDVIDDHLSRLPGVTHSRSLHRLAPEKIADAIAQLGARHASTIAGHMISPDQIEGVTVTVSSEQRAAVAAAAEQQLQREAERIADALEGLHIVEALILGRAFLPPLRSSMDACLYAAGVCIDMPPAGWREAGIAIIDRLLVGEQIPRSCTKFSRTSYNPSAPCKSMQPSARPVFLRDSKRKPHAGG